MEVKIPESVNVVELETAPFKKYSEAKRWARDHGIVGVMSDADTNGKGDIAISVSSISKMLCGAAVRKSVTPAIHYSALVRLRDIIRESFVAEIHPDYKKIGGKRSTSNPVNGKVDIAVLYGCVALGGIDYRAKTTVKIFTVSPAASKAYSYEISNIEILRGYVGTEVQPRDKTSIDARILLNGVCDVNGAPLLAGGRGATDNDRGTPPTAR